MQHLFQVLQNHQSEFNKIVDFNPAKDKLYRFDFSGNNSKLTPSEISGTENFCKYIDAALQHSSAKYGIGGYNENRTLYQQKNIFDGTEPRTIHLGIDVWGSARTIVYAPLGGVVHSFAFNNNDGDYGATVVLQHQLDTKVFHTLYGHLSFIDLARLKERNYIVRGDVIGHFGEPKENGNWPPHLHFQVIEDMRLNKGDYPGVCSLSEREKYLANCPDADLILNMMKYLS